MKDKYPQSLLIAFAILCLLLMSNTGVQAQDNQKPKASPAVQLLLLSEEAPTEPNIVFVTSTTYNANLGGSDGADQKCQDRAQAAKLPKNTYRAWLSTSSVNAVDRLGSARGWVRVDGKPFADTLADIGKQRIFYPIRVDEFGNYDNGTGAVWTATSPAGTLHPSEETCTDWTVSTPGVFGTIGYDDSTASSFTVMADTWCSESAHLYCFGVNNKGSVTVTPVAGRFAFLTKTPWNSGGGVASADDQCIDEAKDAGLGGTFKALLATEGKSAASRFNANGLTWVRRDGVAIAPTAADLLSAEFLDSPINQSADGLQYFGNYEVWNGAATPTTAGASGTTCNNWTSFTSENLAVVGIASATAQRKFFGLGSGSQCNATWRHLYCLQE